MHGHGVALGDTVTASSLMARGQLVSLFNLSVPAVDAFYVACRHDLRSAPIVRAFIDWVFAEIEGSASRTDPVAAAPVALRRRRGRRETA